MRNILFGNGINIQYGGADKYSNSAIIKRLIENVNRGKYDTVIQGISSAGILEFLNSLADGVRNIDRLSRYGNYLLIQYEIDRIRRSYNSATPIENIGFEDLFIILELISNKYNDNNEFRDSAHHGLQMLFLDSIYNNGEINGLPYSAGLSRTLSHYDNVFTLNYDLNLERYCGTVNHLHGQFNMFAPEYDAVSEFSLQNPDKCKANEVVSGSEHMFSNTIMSWYWLEKYGRWLNKENIYGADKFQRMEGQLDIVGMSPCNDEHLFIMINQSGISHVNYYYRIDSDRDRMAHKIRKPITYINVDNFWRRVET